MPIRARALRRASRGAAAVRWEERSERTGVGVHLQLVKVSPPSDLVVRSQLADESVYTPRAEQLHNERDNGASDGR